MSRTDNAGISIPFSISTTWQIWIHLRRPVAHPLYRRMLRTPTVRTTMRGTTWLVLPVGTLICCGLGTLALQFSESAIVPLLLAMVFLSSGIYIIAWVVDISASIAREHRNGTYDPLCVAPPGAMGASQAICGAALHRNDALTWFNFFRILITGLLLFIILMIMMVAVLSQSVFDVFQFLRFCLDIAVLAAASYLDHVQAIVLGCLVGMLVPAYRTSVDAPVLAVVVFITLQAIILLASLLAVMLVVPAVYQALPITGWLVEISPPLLSLLLFYLIREAFNRAMWKTLAFQLNADSVEFSPVDFSMEAKRTG